MNIAISGYGRMGRKIEQQAINRNHKIVAILDNVNDFKSNALSLQQADVAIDFSMQNAVVENILHFFRLNIPVVVGTTGWYDQLETVKECCIRQNKSLLYAPNMSIGANLFFELNHYLTLLIKPYLEYRPNIEERHHVNKLDKPSGTALLLAQEIIKNYPILKKWTTNIAEHSLEQLPILSIREKDTVGFHQVKYQSEIDEITISHNAFNRDGFAIGAVCAAEWLPGHRGIFTMKDLIQESSSYMV